MKKLALFFSIIVFTPMISTCQDTKFPIDSLTGKIRYSDVINVENASSNELYLRAKAWFAHSFNSAQNVIQFDDKESGKIIGKGLFSVRTVTLGSHDAGNIKFTIEIQVKDGKYKYIITDIWHEPGSSSIVSPGDLTLEKPGGGIMTMGMQNWKGIKSQTDNKINNLIDSLKIAMSKKDDNGDW